MSDSALNNLLTLRPRANRSTNFGSRSPIAEIVVYALFRLREGKLLIDVPNSWKVWRDWPRKPVVV
jgi:hypothetical protein